MKVTLTLEQVTHGIEYKGTFEGIGPNLIEYKLRFGVPINKLDSQKMPQDEEQALPWAQKLFQFKVIKSGKELELSKELFGFMMQTVSQLAITFYNNEQTKDYNSGEGLMANAVQKKENSLLGQLGVDVFIGMSNTFDTNNVDIPKELME